MNMDINTTRGFKVFRSNTPRATFATYAKADAYLKANPGCWMQYWLYTDEDEDEEYDYEDSYDLEIGYNPYMGCYDFDC